MARGVDVGHAREHDLGIQRKHLAKRAPEVKRGNRGIDRRNHIRVFAHGGEAVAVGDAPLCARKMTDRLADGAHLGFIIDGIDHGMLLHLVDEAERRGYQCARVLSQRLKQRLADGLACAFHKSKRTHGGLQQNGVPRFDSNGAEAPQRVLIGDCLHNSSPFLVLLLSRLRRLRRPAAFRS